MPTSPHQFHLQVVSGTIMPVEQSMPVLRDAVSGGPDSVQIRDHDAPDAAIRAMVEGLQHQADMMGCPVVINRRADLARQRGIRWIHLGASALRSGIAFDAPGGTTVGVSVHSRDEALLAQSLGADYVTFGHVFETPTHSGVPSRGLDALDEIVATLEIPVLAIGGITLANVERILATGCAGVAVSSSVLGAANPSSSVSALRMVLDRSRHAPRRVMPPVHAMEEQ